MRLEERIVLDGAAAVVVEHAAQTMTDVHVVDTANDANAAQDSHAAHEAKDTAQADSGPADTADAPDVAALLKAVAPQENQSVNAVTPIKDKTGFSTPKDNTQPEEDSVRVLVASSGLADVNDLLGSAKENVVTVTYDGDSDNPDDIFNKIESALGGKQAASIGFASHSIGSGSIHLGGDYSVDADTLLSNPEMTEFWKNVGSLVESDGHIDLLGCGVAGGEVGKDFITKLEQITGREIAASIDDTGNAEAGGNWLLEEGGVDLAQVYFDSGKLGNFDGALATPSITIDLDCGGTSQTLYDVDGDGYYEINSVEKLIALSRTDSRGVDWTEKYELTADIVFDADETKVDWDGDGTVGDSDDVEGFRPIGSDFIEGSGPIKTVRDYLFRGAFKGNAHTIENLFINRSSEDRVALFAEVDMSTIENLNIKGANITGGDYVGAIAGEITDGTILLNSTAVGVVNSSDGHSIGGLVGAVDESKVINSNTQVLVKGNGMASTIGGVAGSVSGAAAKLQNCYATGRVYGHQRVGGLVGKISYSGTVENSYATGTITGRVASVGGLVGFIDENAEVKNSYATGRINGVGADAVGGLAGTMVDGATVDSSYATGYVTANRSAGGLVGLIAAANVVVQNSYATGDVKGDSNNIGGLVGESKGTISNCIAFGSSVSGTTASSSTSAQVSRIVGLNSGTLSGNKAVSSMSVEDKNVLFAETVKNKGDDANDGDDTNGQPYDAYRNWSESKWTFPASGSDNPTLKNVGAQEIVPDPDPVDPVPASNHAPTLSGSVTMNPITENTTDPAGQTVSSLIRSIASDSDSDTLGIAVTFVFNDHGEWQYNNGTVWKVIGTRSSAAALLLAATDKIRFIPDSNWTGDASINFRAWDGTNSKSSGSIVDTSANGGSSAYSADESSSKLTVKINNTKTPESKIENVLDESNKETKKVTDVVHEQENKQFIPVEKHLVEKEPELVGRQLEKEGSVYAVGMHDDSQVSAKSTFVFQDEGQEIVEVDSLEEFFTKSPKGASAGDYANLVGSMSVVVDGDNVFINSLGKKINGLKYMDLLVSGEYTKVAQELGIDAAGFLVPAFGQLWAIKEFTKFFSHWLADSLTQWQRVAGLDLLKNLIGQTLESGNSNSFSSIDILNKRESVKQGGFNNIGRMSSAVTEMESMFNDGLIARVDGKDSFYQTADYTLTFKGAMALYTHDVPPKIENGFLDLGWELLGAKDPTYEGVKQDPELFQKYISAIGKINK